MSLLGLPKWILPHLFTNKRFADLTEGEIQALRERISRFKDETPEVSVVIPAWNEENNIYRTLSSLSASNTRYKVEIIVVNNNSTDGTQKVLDTLGVRNYLQTVQGTPFARQMGLDHARGKFHLCADSDTFYPPDWIDLMVEPMAKNADITGVYGNYAFMPPAGHGRTGLWLYEKFAGLMIQIRKKNREYLNVYGFNMGFVTEVGRRTGGFKVSGSRVYANIVGSDFQNEAEDGRMALNLKKEGELKQVTSSKATVFTSPRRLLDDGSISKAFFNRAKRQLQGMRDYLS
ncbi:glycosyltransferase involved in cell wall biosynthesis [Dyadobacter sp. BE34]|uniref:Glycosyltransferase involved in cell wall biosynthesis n=1 Tax=Dyadobacter fermentans TaxID=94254 RepID=A0ABU1QYB2_9BACT|nr:MULTISPECIES: glycosyltransferase family 2 protein [Dyadobacter]MDR6806149.1 glycosyltransferase involved in cell wall biosynthesis [Dyadobacter fermentans]MDR7043890.1 glycosyltransferase involved in cell wall biosynthesis [Dyadobacter sp. BE242]MDR7198201.1 glycosyltransferase involved in cell wall biosynthesis [Dyadobacter sp. BE34]MDR7216164.1 glycosyltransferase involved in cell wall biosynthesis [Dyadobacter sp. BE31]MDR7264310.1 glycosyltransferase involved in cell wall biosynthesis 